MCWSIGDYIEHAHQIQQFVICFCLNLEIAGIDLILPTEAAAICFFGFSVVDVASLGSIQLCYCYTCWEPCMCWSPRLHSRGRQRLHLHGMKEVLEATAVDDSFQIVFCLSPELGLLLCRREANEKHYQQQVLAYICPNQLCCSYC